MRNTTNGVVGGRQTKDVAKAFARHRIRLKQLTDRYAAPNSNLHFDSLTHGDADLYPSLVDLAERGSKTVRQHHRYFSKRSLYDDGMFWYDLFLLIGAAARRVQADAVQAYIPRPLVDRLLLILFRMTRYSNVNGGDITKRNDEALGNTLLAFYGPVRVRLLRSWAKKQRTDIDWVLKRVNEVRLLPTSPRLE